VLDVFVAWLYKYFLSRPACARSIKPLLLTTCGAWVQLGFALWRL